MSLIAVFVAVLGTSTYFIIDHYKEANKQAELYGELADLVDTAAQTDAATEPAEQIPYSEEKMILPELAELYQQNGDLVGWISIADTNINYPVMQSVNEPNFYLKHGFDKEYSDYGCPYVQEDCDVQEPSDNLVIYGHHMLSHPKDTHWYPVFYVMANTGMRVGEITGLRWSDIDLKKGIIRVNHTLVYYNHRDEKGCYFSINTPKTKAGEREIPMTEGVKQAFLMEREFQSQAEISSKSRVDGYDDFIFVNRYGDVQNQGNLNKALRRMMRDCNDEILEKYGADSDPVLLPQFSCHILRHTFATRLCESGANLKFIQSILGHADVSTTMNIYVDVTDALKKKEITAFDDYMTTKLET